MAAIILRVASLIQQFQLGKAFHSLLDFRMLDSGPEQH